MLLLCSLGDGHFAPESLDPNLCTHGLYGFAEVDADTGALIPRRPSLDLGPGDDGGEGEGGEHDGWRRFTALTDANENFVPMLSVGLSITRHLTLF